MTCYLSVADLIRINERMAARWGGVAGVRDMGLVESAVGLSAVERLQTRIFGSRDVRLTDVSLCIGQRLEKVPWIPGFVPMQSKLRSNYQFVVRFNSGVRSADPGEL